MSRSILMWIKTHGLLSNIWYDIVMRDRFFYLENINNISYYGNLEELKSWVKKQIEAKTAVRRSKNELVNSIKSWNGCLDKKSERDHKLNEIL